jgi:hypothetical protein
MSDQERRVMAIANWIFVSHSSRDLQRVRQIRDFLESRGHSPILFFLLSLTNSSLLPELIKQEIRLRNFFIFCSSEASRKSEWVQEEIRIVKAAFPEKVYEEIDLEADLEPQLGKLLALSKRSTAFLSFSIKDRAIAASMRSALEAADFKVLMDVGELSAGRSFEVAIDDIIGLAAQTGYALLLLSKAHLRSEFAQTELRTAIDKAKLYRRSNIVPVIIEKDVHVPDDIIHLAPFDLTAGDFDDRVRLLVRELKKRDME